MSKAGIYNMTIEQGATYNLDITYTTSDGNAVDLTAAEIRLGVKDQRTDQEFVLYLDNGAAGGITITDAIAGKFNINISAIVTAGLTFNRGVYDLEVIFGDTVVRLLKGRVLVDREVTDE
jgi:hypothetical protein